MYGSYEIFTEIYWRANNFILVFYSQMIPKTCKLHTMLISAGWENIGQRVGGC